MAVARRIGKAFLTVLLGFAVLLWLAALLFFANVTENSADFAEYEGWVLLINVAGIAILVMLIAAQLAALVRDYRRHVPGSKLQARMVSLLVVLAVTPLLIVYWFSVEFINRGIDEWFDVDVEQGLTNALELSQRALDVQKRMHLDELQGVARAIEGLERAALVDRVHELRRDVGAVQLTVFGANNRITATSAVGEDPKLPQPSDDVMSQLSQDRPYVNSVPLPDGGLQVETAVRLNVRLPQEHSQMLHAIFPVEQSFGALANSVTASVAQLNVLNFSRTALKYSFTLTLSLVLLVSILASVYGALFAARRLVVPIQQLMRGTRAVARGDLDTRVPVPARDEIGFLVNSFNDMTQRLAEARSKASASEQQVESERRKLEIILARLSTGVVSLESDLSIRTANSAASAILGVDLEAHVGTSIVELAETAPLLAQFIEVGTSHLAKGETEWRDEIVLKTDAGRRVLVCACTELTSESEDAGAYVVVFDDITTLVQAQRDAAWGEVARRLAHEIKNPLTPIQLSAERMRRRYLHGESSDLELLDRSTHTIIEQVEAMKEMVNAFSQYARAPAIELGQIDLNRLIGEVGEMYRHQRTPLEIELDCDERLPLVEADAGRMRQVLHNLIRNSIEAGAHCPDAKVRISTRLIGAKNGQFVEMKVVDNGPGFAADLIDQAFYPYVTSKEKGTGLGLAIVKKLIEEHGGTIHASNREQGGAEIRILLPVSGGNGVVHPGVQHEKRRERA